MKKKRKANPYAPIPIVKIKKDIPTHDEIKSLAEKAEKIVSEQADTKDYSKKQKQ